MKIIIDDIELDCWEEGYPYWFHIRQGDNMISFNEKQAPAICDALKNLIHIIKKKEPSL